MADFTPSTEFQNFFDYALDGGDSLMEPSEHDNLLFDDGAFSRSRRYFWAIDCLSEVGPLGAKVFVSEPL